ncbi:S41 family peptidase [Prevotella sp. HUN102]|uniref:S41 family peptidase n=1 Tax=Prevotella sp. HUN102 TaxID=1392486 RepID=UPI0004916064|nr:S41 family peptidase [Prevotella sp. HUN102]
MKKILTTVLLGLSLSAAAEENPLWMRFSAISPDGKTIAFSYKGDIFTVPSGGGTARQLTTNPAYDAYPVWSRDGQKIAFASSREGSLDIYLMGKDGGVPKRLTTDSGDELPMAFSNDGNILFSAVKMPTAQSILFASNSFPQTYEVSVEGGRAKMVSAMPMLDVSVNASGDMLYHDQKGYEDKFRKHHRSPIARDIWLYRKGQYRKLTDFNGEDRTPVWSNNADTYYYLSEEDGTFNIYKRNIDGSGKTQLTHHKNNPVRFLTAADNGLLCYGYDGEIYTVRDGGQPQKVNISITTDRIDQTLDRQILTSGATEIKVSPSGKEIAFVLHGDIYVTSTDYRTTKQITDTPEQERDIDFAPDGKGIVYGSERKGLWQIYQTKIKNAGEKNFTYATELVEEQLTKTDKTSQMPKYSPDGKKIAFYEDRAALKVLDLASRNVVSVTDGKDLYSYQDGDIWFSWSPDSRWLLVPYMGNAGWNNPDISLVDASGKQKPYNLTQSGYSDGYAKWALGGKAMLYFSDRAGYRSHGSWGAETDAYLMFFDLDAYDRFRMTKEEKELADAAEKDKKKNEEETKAKDSKKKKTDGKKKDEVKPLQFDLENCRDRIVRLTVNSSRLGDALLSPKGDTLYYQTSFEGGYDLWKRDLKEDKTEIVLKDIGSGSLEADKAFKNIFLCARRNIKKVDLGKNAISNVDFEARFNYKPYEERAYIFDHIWQQVADKFYVEDIHGVDWAGYRTTYERFLPYINNNYDFRDMLGELLGELNASHTGARFNPDGPSLNTAALGLFLDQSHTGDGLKIEEVIKRGPFAVKKTGVEAGCIIEKIDGEQILKDKDYNYLLDGKAGKPIRVSVFNPNTKKRFDVTVKAISKSQEQELLYKRWVDRNRAFVDSISGGRVAYVHVKGMNSPSFRTVYSDLLSAENRAKDAVIVDERHNGGGWLHDDLCTLLSGREYQKFIPHGKFIGTDPFNKWNKPSCVMICEDDYSNGQGFPQIYKYLGIGKLIGAPVAGTMTAVWWETLINGMIFGIPQVGCQDMNGNFAENQQLNPDIEVYNTPEDYLKGYDRQLERAVREMMKK